MEIKSSSGYSVICDEYMKENAALTVIAMHGIGGSRKSGCISRLQKRLQQYNIGLITFDWPAHGESRADDSELRVCNCIKDLKTVYDFVKAQTPNAGIIAFSTSFGAYLTLLFNLSFPSAFQGMILRSPAISFYKDMQENILSEAQIESLRKLGLCSFGYGRIMNISQNFIEDLRDNDILKFYDNFTCNNIDIIHGNKDKTAPLSDSVQFCRQTGAVLHVIEGAGHRFTKPGQIEDVIDTAEKIIVNKYLNA